MNNKTDWGDVIVSIAGIAAFCFVVWLWFTH